jgi:hypothetical protein
MNKGYEAVGIQEGRYLYSVINNGARMCFGDIGINDNKVFTIPHEDIAAVVHSCRTEVYGTLDDEKVKGWILTHNYIIDCASKQFGTVLPFAFGAVVRGSDETVRNWLAENYKKLKSELEKVKNKAEYSVQIFCVQDRIARRLESSDQELKELKEKMEEMSKGAAYLVRRQFELKMKDALAVEISILAADFCSKIREHVDDSKVEKKKSQVPDKYKGMETIMALSCLVSEDKVEKLGEVLDEINNRDGFAVRFTGPWAPFSFVGLEKD